MPKHVVGKVGATGGEVCAISNGDKFAVEVVRKLQSTPSEDLVFGVVGGVNGAAVFGDLRAVAVGIKNLPKDSDAIFLHRGEATCSVVHVVKGSLRCAFKGFEFLRNPTESVAGEFVILINAGILITIF